MKRCSGVWMYGLVLLLMSGPGCDTDDIKEILSQKDYGEIKGELSDETNSGSGVLALSVLWWEADEPDIGIPDMDVEISGNDDVAQGYDTADSGNSQDDESTTNDSEYEEEQSCPNHHSISADDFETCDGSMGSHRIEMCRTQLGVNESSDIVYVDENETSFVLPILELPSEPYRHDLEDIGGTGWYAEGVALAFTDGNEDGKYTPGTPEGTDDLIELLPYSETESDYYNAYVVFLNGKFPNPEMMLEYFGVTLRHGLNVIIENNDEIRRMKEGEALKLFRPESPEELAELPYIQCAELEYQSEINVPVPEEGVSECMVMGTMDSENETMTSIYQWVKEAPDTDNPCIVHIQTAAVCVTDDAQLPDEWADACDISL